MRWLANENYPRASIALLRQAGLDVLAISETAPSINDEDVLALANTEQRVILTFDRDYGELIFRRLLPCSSGVIYFRFIPMTPTEPAERLLQLLGIAGLQLEGLFTTAECQHVRQRPMP
jgi:predicted nuclease of predicted toxin-antitoxin system